MLEDKQIQLKSISFNFELKIAVCKIGQFGQFSQLSQYSQCSQCSTATRSSGAQCNEETTWSSWFVTVINVLPAIPSKCKAWNRKPQQICLMSLLCKTCSAKWFEHGFSGLLSTLRSESFSGLVLGGVCPAFVLSRVPSVLLCCPTMTARVCHKWRWEENTSQQVFIS